MRVVRAFAGYVPKVQSVVEKKQASVAVSTVFQRSFRSAAKASKKPFGEKDIDSTPKGSKHRVVKGLAVAVLGSVGAGALYVGSMIDSIMP